MKDGEPQEEGIAWQTGVWNRMAQVYQEEIDKRFGPIVDQVLNRAGLRPGEAVLDIGTGTGSVALAAAGQVGATGRIVAIDISPDMLAMAQARAEASSISNVDFVEGRCEAIPVPDQSQDAILASLSLMYVLDRASAAREIGRVLRPGGRLVGSVWAGPETADIVLLQQIAGTFAPTPPVDGVGPGALANPSLFLAQLSEAGLRVHVEKDITRFHFADFDSAWNALAGVTTADLEQAIQDRARSAVRERMWPAGNGPREFRNETQFIIAKRIS